MSPREPSRPWRGLAITLLLGACSRPPGPGPTLVSLTFDDTFADTYDARPLLAAHGVHATFYVNSARIGLPGYMTLAELQDLVSDGHEIAGHTVNHADLTTLEPDEQRRQICDDRAALLALGFAVTDFAYPFGDATAEVREIVAECGYDSGRNGSGGLSCANCPRANPVPPPDPYAIRVPTSIKQDTTLSTILGFVRAAEQAGGGWVPLEMHHVCDACDLYAIRAEDLAALLDWLAPRAAQGTTVRNVAEVLGGPVQPAVRGPAAPPPPAGPNLLRNPSLESDQNGDGLPDCWSVVAPGDARFTVGRSGNAHSGSFAASLVVGALGPGERVVLRSREDLGACAPPVDPDWAGRRYQVRAFTVATVAPRFVLAYRTSAGAWLDWTESPPLSASPDYLEQRFTLPALPPDAAALSIGLALDAPGQLLADDLALEPVQSEPP